MNITEKISYKERLITRAKAILEQGKYPTELLEKIKDERLLKEVMKEMMPSAMRRSNNVTVCWYSI